MKQNVNRNLQKKKKTIIYKKKVKNIKNNCHIHLNFFCFCFCFYFYFYHYLYFDNYLCFYLYFYLYFYLHFYLYHYLYLYLYCYSMVKDVTATNGNVPLEGFRTDPKINPLGAAFMQLNGMKT